MHRHHSCGAGRDEPCSSSSCGRWCQPVGTPCTPSPRPALAFPSSAGLLEPKSSKSDGLGRSRELSLGCCKIWRNWDAGEKGSITSLRNAVTVWMGGIKSQQPSKVQDGGTAPRLLCSAGLSWEPQTVWRCLGLFLAPWMSCYMGYSHPRHSQGGTWALSLGSYKT